MLMNNLDPEVAEKPEELIVYGGRGKAARNWECYHKIVETLDRLGNEETLLVQSGKPVGVVQTIGWHREFSSRTPIWYRGGRTGKSSTGSMPPAS